MYIQQRIWTKPCNVLSHTYIYPLFLFIETSTLIFRRNQSGGVESFFFSFSWPEESIVIGYNLVSSSQFYGEYLWLN